MQTWAGCLSGSIGINLLALDLQTYLNVGAIPGNRREDVFQPTLSLVLPYYISTAVIGLLPLVRRPCARAPCTQGPMSRSRQVGEGGEDVFQPTLSLVLPYYISTAVFGLLPLVRPCVVTSEDMFQPTLSLVLPYYISTAIIGLLPLVRCGAPAHVLPQDVSAPGCTAAAQHMRHCYWHRAKRQ